MISYNDFYNVLWRWWWFPLMVISYDDGPMTSYDDCLAIPLMKMMMIVYADDDCRWWWWRWWLYTMSVIVYDDGGCIWWGWLPLMMITIIYVVDDFLWFPMTTISYYDFLWWRGFPVLMLNSWVPMMRASYADFLCWRFPMMAIDCLWWCDDDDFLCWRWLPTIIAYDFLWWMISYGDGDCLWWFAMLIMMIAYDADWIWWRSWLIVCDDDFL